MAVSRRVLVIDEDAAFRRYAHHVLSGMDYEVVEATSGRAGLQELSQWTPDCVVVDLDLPDLSGIDVLRSIATDLAPRPPVIAVSANLSVQSAVEAMKRGAKDAVEKPIQTERLRKTVQAAVETSDLASDMGRLQSVLPTELGAEVLETRTQQMTAVVERMDRLASVEMPVLIVGEGGTGTQALARRLHSAGPRREKPFIVVPESGNPKVVEAALFGSNGRPSAFAQAQDGSVFVEDLVSLGDAGQQRLARVLAEVSAARASGQPVACPRIIVASKVDMSAAVAGQQVREDLAHRLTPLTVTVPPLRDRRADIPGLVARMADKVAAELKRTPVAFGDDVLRQFSEREWPGNCEELQAAVVRGMLLSKGGTVRIEDVTGPSKGANGGSAKSTNGWHPTLDDTGATRRFDDYEAEIFRYALDKAGGCVSRAAESLGVGRATMYRKMRSYDIDAPPVSERAIIRTGRRKRKKAAEPAAAAAPAAGFVGDKAA